MGAIDLVVQIEAPPSVASGLQRIGRGGHQANAVSEGVIFPKFRGDLVACAAVAKAMHDGAVEATRYPRNPLDIVAQQIVAMAAMDQWDVDELFATVRRAAPFAELSRDGVRRRARHAVGPLPVRRIRGAAAARHVGSRRRHDRRARRREARGDRQRRHDSRSRAVRRLPRRRRARARRASASSTRRWSSRAASARRSCSAPRRWRIEEITHDRVLVSPAPGQPGKMPFWKGDRAGRPLELGLAIGRLMRDLLRLPPAAAIDRLTRDHDLDARAAENLLQYLARSDGGDARRPRCRDDRRRARARRARRLARSASSRRAADASTRRGRWPSPRRSARSAASTSRRCGATMGSWCGFPDVDEPPDPRLLLPDPDEVQALVVRQLGATALFAAKFRENAARSLLLPKRRPGMRTPLWQQRKRVGRSAGGRVALRIVSRAARDLPRVPARFLRHAGARRDARRRPQPEDPRRDRRFRHAVAVCRVAALQLRRQLSLRRRRAARRAPRAGARRRSGAAARAARRAPSCASCSTPSRWTPSSGSCSGSIRGITPRARTASTTCCSRIGDLTDEELAARDVEPGRRRRRVGAGQRAPRSQRARRRRGALHRGRGRRALSRCARRAAAARDSRGAARSRCAIRWAISRCATRARTRRSPPSTSRRATALSPPAAEAVLMRLAAEGRLVEGEFRPGGTRARVDRRRRPAHAAAPLAREAAARDRTGRARRRSAGSRRRGRGSAKRRRGADALLDAIEQLQGAPLAGVDSRDGDPAGAGRGLRPGRSRRRDRGRRSRLGRRRAARRSRRARRAVPRGSSADAAAAGHDGPKRSAARTDRRRGP